MEGRGKKREEEGSLKREMVRVKRKGGKGGAQFPFALSLSPSIFFAHFIPRQNIKGNAIILSSSLFSLFYRAVHQVQAVAEGLHLEERGRAVRALRDRHRRGRAERACHHQPGKKII